MMDYKVEDGVREGAYQSEGENRNGCDLGGKGGWKKGYRRKRGGNGIDTVDF